MNPIQRNEIKEIKEKIDELMDYISSDFCQSCLNYYKEIEVLQQRLKELEQE
jgi:hypothetical protein